MKISNSKRQLAQLLIEAGVTQFPKGANWAAQDKAWGGHVNSVLFYRGDSKPCMTKGDNSWTPRADDCWLMYNIQPVQLPTLIPNWHQTVLSRDEFDQIIAETVSDADGWIEWGGKPESPVDKGTLVDVKMKNGMYHEAQLLDDGCWSHVWGDESITAYRQHKPEQAKPEFCESVTRSIQEPETKPSIESLAADYRNKLDYANRKQDEAEKAKVESNAALSELEKAIAAIGFAITPICAAAQEYATPNWRNWVRGDEIKCKKTPPGAVKSIGLTGYVSKVYGDCVEVAFEHHIAVAFGGLIDECFEFVNRPAK